MKAFVMHGIGRVGLMEKPVPQDPGPNDAIIKTTAALICTSDVHTVHGAIGERKDLTLGHEAVGIIYKLGKAVKGLKEGDRVVVNAITPSFMVGASLTGSNYPVRSTPFPEFFPYAQTKLHHPFKIKKILFPVGHGKGYIFAKSFHKIFSCCNHSI
ncbi:MAG: alcohol dehydrogenase catalytic domain-containing protein [Thermoanaerobacter sp.]|nr:alcohol dehydrogenase catalytic domain-containing protein [Thermoanaerobacter sp.]